MTEPPVLHRLDETHVRQGGRRLAYFAGSDYLRLSWHPEVRRAGAEAVERWGLTPGASRMTTGNLAVYGKAEKRLASYFGAASATLTSAGYLAPLVAVQALADRHTHVLLDERAHACLCDAAALSGLPVRRFPHRDPEGLVRGWKRLGSPARALILTDGLFTHAGEVAPLADYRKSLPPSSTLLVDDAHGVGILGPRGRGSVEWTGAGWEGVVVTGTLSKALGCYGGVVLGSTSLPTLVRSHSRIFTGNTPVPPPCAAAVGAAIAVLRREGGDRRSRLAANVARVKETIGLAGSPVGGGPGPMFSIAPHRPAAIRRLQGLLLDAGIHPPLIRYPNGPAPQYFRFALSSEHTIEQVSRLGAALAEFLQR